MIWLWLGLGAVGLVVLTVLLTLAWIGWQFAKGMNW